MPTIVSDWRTPSRALTSSIDPQLTQLLVHRVRQLDVPDLTTAARFVIVEAGDTIADAEQALGFSILQNPTDGTCFGDPDFTPGWEWIEDHGHCWELVFILTDDGFAHVVIVPREPGIDKDLLAFCATYASEQAVI